MTGRIRLATPAMATAVCAVVVALMVLAIPLSRATRDVATGGGDLSSLVVVLPFALVGVVVARRQLGIAAHAIVTHTVHIETSGDLSALNHPTGSATWWGLVQNVFFPVVFISGVGSLAKQIVSYRGAIGERCQQLKWLLEGGAIFSSGLRDAVDLDRVQRDLVAVVHLSMQPSHVSVWLRERSPV
jgi:hypothetical protein